MSYSDQSIPFGTEAITLSNGTTYHCESFDFPRNSQKIRRYDSDGTPGGSYYEEDHSEGTMTLQLGTTSTAYPTQYLTFSRTISSQYGSETFVITDISTPESNQGDKKVTCTFSKVRTA